MRPSKVTIAIPTLNRERYLELALASALGQTYKNLEIVVSNNASVDETEAFLASQTDPRLKILRQQTKLSMVGNWNACLQAATGEYFLMLSDDDLLEPQAIERMVAAYENAENIDRVGIVYAGGRVIDAQGNEMRPGQPGPPEESASALVLGVLSAKRDAWPCSILLRRSDMGDGYSDNFLLITDAAMWFQAVVRHGVALYVDDVLVNYRVHQNLSNTTRSQVWVNENNKFVAYAITCLEAAGQAEPGRILEMRRALSRLNTRLAVCMPLDRPGAKFTEILREYWSQLPLLASFYGVSLLVYRLYVLCVPRSLGSVARRLRSGAKR